VISAQLIVLYDVQRSANSSQIEVVNGYFVHFFAPDDLPISPKRIVFVVDSSGSMMGRKIEQTKVGGGFLGFKTDENLYSKPCRKC